ncbi:MAG TPA: MerR family transcriptional regulator, partial [Candidatus Limnocylindrales bacterium]
MTGIAVASIRNWEDRYGVVSPQRSGGGQRLYSRDQIDALQFIARQVGAGLSPADAHRMLAEGLAAAAPEGNPDGRVPKRRLAILLAERDPYAAELAEFFLRTEGYEVTLTFD